MANGATTSVGVPTEAATFSEEVTEESVRRDSWWTEFISGTALTLLGIGIVFWPLSTYAALVLLVGAFLLVLGIVDIFRGILSIGKNWVWVGMTLLGILSVIVGVFVLRYPVASALTYVYVLGFYFLFWGIIKLFMRQSNSELRVLGIIGGIFTILLGIVLLMNPITGGLTFYWITGIFALVFGPVQIALAFRVKHATEQDREKDSAYATKGRRLPATS